jgi:hypothetical protein
MQVDIAEPCHENWNQMSPTEKGAFCGKCQIDVVDFSNKTALEVKQILHDNIGKNLCGRFKKVQLEELNSEYLVWENQSIHTFQSKFLLACVLVFGMTLFSSCANGIAQDPLPIDFGIEKIKDSLFQPTDTLKGFDKSEKVKKNKLECTEILMGDIAYDPEEFNVEDSAAISPTDSVEINQLEIPKTDEITWDDEIHINPDAGLSIGVIVMTPDPDFIAIPHVVIELDDTLLSDSLNLPVNDVQTIHEDDFVKGKMIAPKKFDRFIKENVALEPEPSTLIEENKLFETKLFPNPALRHTTLEVSSTNRGNYLIELYNFEGKKMETIHQGQLDVGTSIFQIDLTGYSKGIYIVNITSENRTETIKLNYLGN